MTPRWTYDLWAVRMPDGSLAGWIVPVWHRTRRDARDSARRLGGVPVRVSVEVKELRG